MGRVLRFGGAAPLVLVSGGGVGPETRAHSLAALGAGKAVVLDADALSSFQDRPEALFEALSESGPGLGLEPGSELAAGTCVLTPHEGEFRRLFPDLGGDKVSRARAAAARSGAVVLIKGADSAIAAPDGRTAINANAPPVLATAGTGDVLAGLIVGLLAQGLNAFDATCAAVWLHGEAGAALGPGLIAEDLCEALPGVLQALRDLLRK